MQNMLFEVFWLFCSGEFLNELSYFPVGPPLPTPFRKNMEQTLQSAAEPANKYRKDTMKRGFMKSKLYDGIEKLLKALKNDGFKLAIASSKPQKI